MTIGLQIQEQEIDQKMVMRIIGRLDAASAPILENKVTSLLEGEHDFLILDFQQLEYLSSAGMRFLLSATKQLKAKNGHLVLFGIRPEVMDIISMAGFDQILNICSTQEEALSFS